MDVPPEVCFAALVAYERYPDWYPGVRVAEVLEQSSRASKVRLVFGGIPMVPDIDCVLQFQAQPSNRLVPKALSGGMTIGGSGWSLEPASAGRTTASYEITVEMSVPGGFVTERVIKGRARQYLIEEPVARLKRLVEQPSG